MPGHSRSIAHSPAESRDDAGRFAPPARLRSEPLLEAIDSARRAYGGPLRHLLGSKALVEGAYRARSEGTVPVRMAGRLCAQIGVDPHVLYGDAYHDPVTPDHHSHPAMRLSAGPLLEAVDARVRAVPCKDIDGHHPSCGRTLLDLLGASGTRAFHRAQEEGSLTLRSLEGLCDLLGWHPYELYGEVYQQAALRNAGEDFDQWYEQWAEAEVA